MPFVNPPIETFIELQYSLSNSGKFLADNDYLQMQINVDEKSRTFLKSIGLTTIQDCLKASKETIGLLYKRKHLFQSVLEPMAFVNKEYRYSFSKDSVLTVVGDSADIIRKGEASFLERNINIYLYPQLANRLKKSMDRVNISKYKDLKNFLINSDVIDYKGLGLESHRALSTIIVTDYEYLKNNGMLDESLEVSKEKTVFELFIEVLNKSWNCLDKKIDIEFHKKWLYQIDCLCDDVIFALRRKYGEKESLIIINSFLSEDEKYSREEIEIELGVTSKYIDYIETVYREEYLSAFTDLRMINRKNDNRAHKFFLRLIKFGNEEMAEFIGIIMHMDVYSEILKRIEDKFPSVRNTFDEIREFYRSLDNIGIS